MHAVTGVFGTLQTLQKLRKSTGFLAECDEMAANLKKRRKKEGVNWSLEKVGSRKGGGVKAKVGRNGGDRGKLALVRVHSPQKSSSFYFCKIGRAHV